MPANIAGLPDYDDPAYNEPVYGDSQSSYAANRAQYTKWRRLWAERHFHEVCEDFDRKKPDKPLIGIIDLLHHPSFPKVFQQKIGGASEEGEPLHPVDVKDFLEIKYAATLERPDWEYLLDIISHLEKEGTVPIPQNLQQARQWLEAKRSQLLAWPPIYDEPDAKGRRRRLDNISAFNTKSLRKKPQANLEDLVKKPLTLPRLKELLCNLELLQEFRLADVQENPSASPGAWGGVVQALIKKGLILPNRSKICSALKNEFQASVSEKTLQNAAGLESRVSKSYYNRTLSHLTSLKIIS
jgi:hypothetical protein